jgi:hypothetical protein
MPARSSCDVTVGPASARAFCNANQTNNSTENQTSNAVDTGRLKTSVVSSDGSVERPVHGVQTSRDVGVPSSSVGTSPRKVTSSCVSDPGNSADTSEFHQSYASFMWCPRRLSWYTSTSCCAPSGGVPKISATKTNQSIASLSCGVLGSSADNSARALVASFNAQPEIHRLFSGQYPGFDEDNDDDDDNKESASTITMPMKLIVAMTVRTTAKGMTMTMTRVQINQNTSFEVKRLK